MYAVVNTGGKQYKVQKGETLRIEKIPGEVGSAVTFDKVLMVADGDNIRLGQPVLENVAVQAQIVEQDKAKKILRVGTPDGDDAPVDLRGAALYHCGPVALKKGEEWLINAAGPTTSSREEPYQADVIRKFGLRAVMGKGGMGAKTLAALKEQGAVYLNAIGDLPATGSVALYVPNTTTSLVDPDQITDFVQWGAGNQANSATAVLAGPSKPSPGISLSGTTLGR